MAEFSPWGQYESGPFREEVTRDTQRRKMFENQGSDKDMLIHPTFPKMGVINPTHKGSMSVSPNKGDAEGDYEEDLPKMNLGSGGAP